MSTLQLQPNFEFPRTPKVRTRSQKTKFKLHSPLKQHYYRTVLKPSNQAINTPPSAPTTTSSLPAVAFTFVVDLMPPKQKIPGSSVNQTGTLASKRKVSRTIKNPSNSAATLPTHEDLLAAQSGSKRALSPSNTIENDIGRVKRLRVEESQDSLAAASDTNKIEENVSIPPSSSDLSMSIASKSDYMDMSLDIASIPEPSMDAQILPERRKAPFGTIEETPKASEKLLATPLPIRPSGIPIPTPASRLPHLDLTKFSPSPWKSLAMKGSTSRALPSAIPPRTPKPFPKLTGTSGLKFPTGPLDFNLPTSEVPALSTIPVESSEVDSSIEAPPETPMEEDPIPIVAEVMEIPQADTKVSMPAPKLTARPDPPVKKRPPQFSAAFALPVSLSPIKSPVKSFVPKSKPTIPKPTAKPSILKRAGTFTNVNEGTSLAAVSKPPISSTLAALMNRTTIDPHEATQAQLSTLSQALDELDVPRPASALAVARPATSTGFLSAGQGSRGFKPPSSKANASKQREAPPRPNTSLGMAGARKGAMHPPVAGATLHNNAASIEARRASNASLALSQSLPVTAKPGPGGSRPPVYTTASGRRVVSATARAAPLPGAGKLKMSTSSSLDEKEAAESSVPLDQASTSTNIAPSKPLDILKDCVIFVDVKTEDGEDAGSLFVDMLKGLGARLLKAPGGSLTHIVYKTGLPSTLTKFRALQDPKPKVVGIGWVVDCVEKREKVDTARYEISLEEEAGSILDSVKPTKGGTKTIQTKLQFKPVGKSTERENE